MGRSEVIYEYRCRSCGYTANVVDRADSLGGCPNCPGELRRVWSVQIAPVMQEHFNATVQKPVSSMRQFEAELRRASDEATERTGIEHRFAPVDPTDRKALGVTSEGLAATNRHRVATGQRPVAIE